MKKKISLLMAAMILNCLFAGVGAQAQEFPAYYGAYGSCKHIDGRTVIVSVFADDSTTSWDFEDEGDLNSYSMCYKMLRIASEWMEEQVASYGKEAQIIWDWYNNSGLFFTHAFDAELTNLDSLTYPLLKEYLNEYVDSEAIMAQYNADNILYYIFVDTPSDFSKSCNSYNANELELLPGQYVYEMVVCYSNSYNRVTSTPSYAHEMLHAFGAPDLYYESSYYNITKEYVQHLKDTNSKDIMFGHGMNYEEITEDFSDVDAYYTGLIDYAADVVNWGLAERQFDRRMK